MIIDKQKIMAKYTKLAMKRLYGIKCYVFFRKMEGYRGMFRPKEIPPYSFKDYEIYFKKKLPSITYDETLYTKKSLAEHAWVTLVHEVTHHTENMSCDENRRLFHSKRFREVQKENLNKLDELRMKFNLDVGWKKDFVCEDADEYEEEDNY